VGHRRQAVVEHKKIVQAIDNLGDLLSSTPITIEVKTHLASNDVIDEEATVRLRSSFSFQNDGLFDWL